MTQSVEITLSERLLDAALFHVPFDGWGDDAFRAACADLNIDESLARLHCPNGALDLAILSHKRGDQAMVDRLAAQDLGQLRFRDKIAAAERARQLYSWDRVCADYQRLFADLACARHG